MIRGSFFKIYQNLVKVIGAACIAASMAFGQAAQIGSTTTYWELTGTAPNQTLIISGTGNMPTSYLNADNTPPWYSSRNDITAAIIQDGVTSIGNRAFYFCNKLTSVTIPNSVTTIRDYSFYSCWALTTITISAYVTSISTGVFNGCSELTAINVDASNNNYASTDGVLFNKTKTTLIQYPLSKTGTTYTIPSSVTSIEQSAFANCNKLTSVTIPNSVTSIGNTAFSACAFLTSVTIGNSVTSIGNSAFFNCPRLTSITIPDNVTSIGTSAFASCTGLTQIINFAGSPQTLANANTFQSVTIPLYVPGNAVSAYGAANIWSTFTNIQPITAVMISTQPSSASRTFGSISGSLSVTASITQDLSNAATLGYQWYSNTTASNTGGTAVSGATGSSFNIPTNLSAGTYHYYCVVSATYAADAVSNAATVNVAKAAGNFGSHPAVSATYTPTLKLSDINLNEGYFWDALIITPLSAGDNQNFTATYTDPSGNYNSASGNIVVNVAKANPTVTFPTSATITYGQTLSQAAFVGQSNATAGNFAFTEGATHLTVSQSTSTHPVKFTPTDTDNYNTLTQNVAVTVNKAGGLTATTPGKQMISSGYRVANQFDLSTIALHQTDHGTLTYSLGAFNDQAGDNKILTAAPTLDGRILTYTGNGKESGTATQVINIKSENYTDISTTITFEATPKTRVSIGGLTAQNSDYDGTQKLGVIGTATSGAYTGKLDYTYAGTGIETTTTEQPKNAGDYTLIVSVPDTSSHYVGSERYEFSIAKATIAKPEVTAANLVYTGIEQSAGITENAHYTITDGKATNAGDYTAIVVLKDKTNYEWTTGGDDDLLLPWKIAKATIAIPAVTAANLVYNKGLHSAGIAENDNYTITDGSKTNAGDYTAKVALKDKANYEWTDGTTADLNLPWKIAKADYDMVGVSFVDAAFTHDGQPHSILINGTPPQGVSVASYTNNGQTAEGTYTITVTFSVADPVNYNVPAPMTATLVINNKKTYDMSGITFADSTVTYDGKAHSIKISGNLPAGVTVSYEGNEQTKEGVHKIIAKFTTSDPTYNAPSDKIAFLTIEAAVPINKIQKSDGRVGIRLSKTIVSQKAEFEVILPDNDKVQEVKAVIYDNTGNVVFTTTQRGANVSWNLTNGAGRNVANGTYLIVVEAKGAKGSYAYSTKVGVKR